MNQIVYNAVECKDCKQLLISRYGHDFVQCSCPSKVFTDGGLNYQRVGNPKRANIKSVYLNDDYEEVRKVFARYDANKKEYIPLKDMELKWLERIMEYYFSPIGGKRIEDWALCLYLKEKQCRMAEEY